LQKCLRPDQTATRRDKYATEKEFAKQHEASIARGYATGLKASRDQIRKYLQKKKALLRIYAPGDWVLRVRQRKHKHDPYYDGLCVIVGCHSGNIYTLRSPEGIVLDNKYNGSNLFPAYVQDGHPVRSL
jgi:hypothetical protein